jgi:Virulence factor SrfB
LMAETAGGPKAPLATAGGLPAHFGRRFDGKVIRAAAESCLRSSEAAAARTVDATRVFTLKGLAARGGGRLGGLAEHFDAAAAAAGAVNFRLENVTVRLRQRQVAELIKQAVEPVIAPFCDLIASQACDLVLLEGRLAQLPDVVDELRRRLRLPAHCIVDVARHAPSNAVSTAMNASLSGPERQSNSRITGAVGAYLASQHAIRSGNFKLVTADVAASLQHFRPVAIARSGRSTRLLTDAQPAAAAGSGGDGNRTHGALVRVNTVNTVNTAPVDVIHPDAIHSGAPRRRYAGERDQ